MPLSKNYRPWPRHTLLGEGFFDDVLPAVFPRHELRYRNQALAEELGLGALDADEWEGAFARFEPLLCNLHRPIALRYHGHQFGAYNPRLGDGRGFLFAQVREPGSARLLDLATKGSGPTPWSRGGDGKLTLKGGIREVLASTALASLGVPTSRSLSLFETGEQLYRGDEPSPTRSSVLVRVGHSHLRFGTFQRVAYLGERAAMTKLLRHAVAHYVPELDPESPVVDLAPRFVRIVTARTASLVATWMAAGFVHGVLNTDNLTITGESFDYGPYRFLPTFDETFVAAYFDGGGRYAYGKQPDACLWSLERLASSLALVGDEGVLLEAAREFSPIYDQALGTALAKRLGLEPDPTWGTALALAVFHFLNTSQIPFERFFFDAFGGLLPERVRRSPERERYRGAEYVALERLVRTFAVAADAGSRLGDPYFAGVDPETLLIDEIEAIWSAIDVADDFGPFEAKVRRLEGAGRARG